MASVGLMLYTVRDECARDFEATLRAVAAMGFEGVELFDLHGHEPGDVRRWLDELGLPACGRHAPLDAIETRLPELAEEAEVIGWRRLVLSWLDRMVRGTYVQKVTRNLRPTTGEVIPVPVPEAESSSSLDVPGLENLYTLYRAGQQVDPRREDDAARPYGYAVGRHRLR